MTEEQMKDALTGLRSELMKMMGKAALEDKDAGKMKNAESGMTSISNLSHVLGVALPDRAG